MKCDDGNEQRYALPLALASGELADAIAKDTPQRIVANITGARRGVLYEALTDESALRLRRRRSASVRRSRRSGRRSRVSRGRS